MERLFKNSRRLMASLGVVAFLMVAGWQVGVGSAEGVFSETEVALENAVGGSDGGPDSTCTVSSDPDQNQGGCRRNPYGGDMCVLYSHGPSCRGTINS